MSVQRQRLAVLWIVVVWMGVACASQPVAERDAPPRSEAAPGAQTAAPEPAQPADAPAAPNDGGDPAVLPKEPTATPTPPKAPDAPALPFEVLRPEEVVDVAADAPETRALVDRVNGAVASFQACATEHRKGDAFGVAIVELELEQTVFKREIKVGSARALRALASDPEVVRCVERVAETIGFEQDTAEGSLVARMSFRTFVFVGPRREVGALFRSFDTLRADMDAFRSCAGIDGRKLPEHRAEVTAGALALTPVNASPKVLKGLKRHAKKVQACGDKSFAAWVGGQVGYVVVE